MKRPVNERIRLSSRIDIAGTASSLQCPNRVFDALRKDGLLIL
jgi:hypothetical protein